MRHLLRVGVVFGALSLLVLTPGCSENNETTAQISGKAPDPATAPKTQADLKKSMGGGGGGSSLPKNYPGNRGGS